MGTSYADIADVKATLSVAGADTYLDDALEKAVASASDGIDKELGRTFGKDEDDTVVRSYMPPASSVYSGELEIDDLVELASLRVDKAGDGTWETWTLGTDFRLEPINADVDEEPWTHVRVLASQRWPTRPLSLVEITGQWGWPDVPAAITEATGIIAEQLLVRKAQAPLGVLTAGAEIGAVAYIARHDPQVAGLIAGYYRRRRQGSVQLT